MSRPAGDQWRAINERGDEELALAFAHLFWPQFVERRGCVLLAHRANDEQISLWLEQSDGDLQKVEAMLNHVHLYDELPQEGHGSDDDLLMEVARIMGRTWQVALAEQFPGREFWIDLAGPEQDYGPTLYLMRGSQPDRPGEHP